MLRLRAVYSHSRLAGRCQALRVAVGAAGHSASRDGGGQRTTPAGAEARLAGVGARGGRTAKPGSREVPPLHASAQNAPLSTLLLFMDSPWTAAAWPRGCGLAQSAPMLRAMEAVTDFFMDRTPLASRWADASGRGPLSPRGRQPPSVPRTRALRVAYPADCRLNPTGRAPASAPPRSNPEARNLAQ